MGSGFTRAKVAWVLPRPEPDPDPRPDRARTGPEPGTVGGRTGHPSPGQQARAGLESALKPDHDRAEQGPSQTWNRTQTSAGLSLTRR